MDKDIFLECRLQGLEAVGDEAGRFKKHDTLLDSGLVNLDPALFVQRLSLSTRVRSVLKNQAGYGGTLKHMTCFVK